MKFPADDPEGMIAAPRGTREAEPRFTVGLVSDDSSFLRRMEQALAQRGFEVTAWFTAGAFFRECGLTAPDCVVMDLSASGADQFDAQEHLPSPFTDMPATLLSGQINTPNGVMAAKAVAVHCAAKLPGFTKLLGALQQAMAESVNGSWAQQAAGIRGRFASLTPREMEVFLHVIAGKLNKQIASDLGISLQTVKIHRMRITEKSGLPSVAELARAACLAGYQPVS